jgi:hypothetical protein
MEREYLKNDICEFKPLFNIDYNVKKNILSTCFFKMVNSGYRDFSEYVKGLIVLNNLITKSNLNYKIRLFIDTSIYSDKIIFDKILSLKNVEPVLYSCSNYIIDNNYHIGLFGTIVRFFPFFDFPNNDANIVVSADIDSTNIKIFQKYIKLLKSNDVISKLFNQIYIFKSGPLNRSLQFNFDIFYKNKFNPYIYALSFVSIKRINSKILINFLNEVNQSDDKKIYSYHYLSNSLNNLASKESKSKYDSHGKFIYGIDEYFLNTSLSNYLIDNKMCYVVNTTWDIFGCLYYILLDSNKLSEEQIKLIDLMFEYVYKKLGFEFDKNISIKEKFNKLDKIIYSDKKEHKKIKYKINKLFYKLFLYFKKNKNYKFVYPEGYYKLLVDDEKYFGTYSIEFIRIINCKQYDEDIILEQKQFKQKDIERLKDFYIKQ